MRKLFFSSLVLSFFLLLQGCSESTFTEPKSLEPSPNFNMGEVLLPKGVTLSPNQFSQDILNQIDGLDLYTTFLIPSEVFSTIQTDDTTWVHEWSVKDKYAEYGDFDFNAKLTITENIEEKTRYTFKVVVTGTISIKNDDDSQKTYDLENFLFIDAHQIVINDEANEGQIIIWSPEKEEGSPNYKSILDWKWNDLRGNRADFVLYEDYLGTISLFADSSGNMKIYEIPSNDIKEDIKLLLLGLETLDPSHLTLEEVKQLDQDGHDFFREYLTIRFDAIWQSNGDGEWWSYTIDGQVDNHKWTRSDYPEPF